MTEADFVIAKSLIFAIIKLKDPYLRSGFQVRSPVMERSIASLQSQLLEHYLGDEARLRADEYFVIGDSHANFFDGTERINFFPMGDLGVDRGYDILPIFKTFHVGPALAYNLVESGSAVRAREKILYLLDHHIPRGSKLLLCFGEIDCRYHILRQAEKRETPANELVRACVARYFRFVDELLAMGYRPSIWGPVPSQPDWVRFNREFPKYGTVYDRNKITFGFHRLSAAECKRRGLAFFSIFQYVVRPDGSTDERFITDGCHLSQRAMPIVLRNYFT